MDFEPVDLVSPDGRPWVARSAADVVNLTARGYKPAPPEPTPEPSPIALLVPSAPPPSAELSGDLPQVD